MSDLICVRLELFSNPTSWFWNGIEGVIGFEVSFIDTLGYGVSGFEWERTKTGYIIDKEVDFTAHAEHAAGHSSTLQDYFAFCPSIS